MAMSNQEADLMRKYHILQDRAHTQEPKGHTHRMLNELEDSFVNRSVHPRESEEVVLQRICHGLLI